MACCVGAQPRGPDPLPQMERLIVDTCDAGLAARVTGNAVEDCLDHMRQYADAVVHDGVHRPAQIMVRPDQKPPRAQQLKHGPPSLGATLANHAISPLH